MVDLTKIKECPKCGETELGKGRHSGYAVITPNGKVMGSNVEHIICTNCGYIIESYVAKPKRFKDTFY